MIFDYVALKNIQIIHLRAMQHHQMLQNLHHPFMIHIKIQSYTCNKHFTFFL